MYDPEGDGTALTSLGVHEHWNDPINRQYSRNLGEDKGIELVYVDATSGSTTSSADRSKLTMAEITLFPNPVADAATLAINTEVMGDFNVEVITISGKRAGMYNFIKSANNQNFNLDLSNLAPGTYICRVSGHGFSEKISFIKLN